MDIGPIYNMAVPVGSAKGKLVTYHAMFPYY